MAALAAPFPAGEIKFRPGAVSGNRALALAYVTARAVQDRLDETLGLENWQDNYECLPDGSVVCRLQLRIGGEWLCKVDVGSPSEQPDGGDRLKAAFSDALKRAAVKFGVGRYLYRLPSQWVDFNPQTRRFVRLPNLAPGSYSEANGKKEATIDDEQRQHLTALLTRKGRTPGAALKTAGCHSADLADITVSQYRVLVEKLDKLPDAT
jgi:hypothetical protein